MWHPRCNLLKWWTLAGFSTTLALAPPICAVAGPSVKNHPSILRPVEPACVSSPFGPRTLSNRPLAGSYHSGIDLPAPIGSAVFAVASGTIIRIQRHGVGGLEMLI